MHVWSTTLYVRVYEYKHKVCVCLLIPKRLFTRAKF